MTPTLLELTLLEFVLKINIRETNYNFLLDEILHDLTEENI